MSYIWIFTTFIITNCLYSQTEIDYKNQLLDSLKNSKVDTILILKNDCYGCGGSYVGRALNSERCSYNETYTLFWKKNNISFFKQFDRCYESNIIKAKSNIWIDYYSKNIKELNTLKIIIPDSIIKIKQDTINYSKCTEIDSTELFSTLENDYFFEYEIILGKNFYSSGEITNNLFCDSRTKNRQEIKILNQFYKIIYEDYLYPIEYNYDIKKKNLKNWETNEIKNKK